MSNDLITLQIDTWEHSVIVELINDSIENCDHNVEHCKHQRFIKEEKRQLERVKEYEKEIEETLDYKQKLERLAERLKIE